MIERDVLFVAMTRPATTLGLPLDVLISIILISMLAFGIMSNVFIGMAVAAPLYLAARLIVHYDINTFRLIYLWALTNTTKGKQPFSVNRKILGGNSYSPTALSLARRKGYGRVQSF